VSRVINPGNVVHATRFRFGFDRHADPHQAGGSDFTLSARSLDDVREAMERGPVEVIAFSQDNKRELAKGALLLTDNIVDQAGATRRLKAMFPNEHDELWPGDFVNACSPKLSRFLWRPSKTARMVYWPGLGDRERRCSASPSDRNRTDDRPPHPD
jgi:hypothetical protein